MVSEAPPSNLTTARVVLGTAGHIDHGKTALVRALTGIDTDRLPEEKARGITIELGFAHLEVNGRRMGVVDVPGHERFVRTMVAGATGIDILLLVVAADEGVMPQTREHLDICRLLAIPRGVVALTKADLVDDELLALAVDDVRAQLRGTEMERAAIIPCSSLTGAGLDDLRREICRLAEQAAPRPADGPVRLPIDRVFTVKGFGTVATGTLTSGSLRSGDDLISLPGVVRGKVRGVEVHGTTRAQALAGERTAVNLAIERGVLGRGGVLVRPDEMEACSVIDVELSWSRLCPGPLRTRARLLFHALTTQENASIVLLAGDEVSPGETAVAQIHLENPIALLPGDRFVLRGFQPLPGHGSTVGGGRVVRTHARKHRRADAAAADLARRMAAAQGADRVLLEVEAAGCEVLDHAQLRGRLGLGPREIDRALEPALARRKILTVHRERGAVVHAAAVERIGREVLWELQRFHDTNPLEPGFDRESLRSTVRALRGCEQRLYTLVLTELERAGKIAQDHDRVRLAGFTPRAAEQGTEGDCARVLHAYAAAGLAPPWSNELPALLSMTPAACDAAVQVMLRRGALVKVKTELLFEREVLGALRERLRNHLEQHAQITAQEWKQLTGQTRKYAIPLAEYFDAEKLTLRVGEVRKLRR